MLTMLKLKYLFDNLDLSLMLLRYWEPDMDTKEAITHFRTSANAVYSFHANGQKYFLRFIPVEEKPSESIQAELDFLKFLRNNGYPAVKAVPSKDDRELVVANTPWGLYNAVVFEEAKGTQISNIAYDDSVFHDLGKSLGRLHKLSSGYCACGNFRPDWKQTLEWCESVFRQYPAVPKSFDEVRLLSDFFSKLEQSRTNYGLIHYDFEIDNVFYDQDRRTCYPIDFDDAVYHWYAMDVTQTIASIRNDLPKEYIEQAEKEFLRGYRTQMELAEHMLALMPVFHRYANLYGYARILRSVYDSWDNEPKWMANGLRPHIARLMQKRTEAFGSEISL